jgi:hypothetical protein
MAGGSDDASTDVEKFVKSFAKDMSASAATILKNAADKKEKDSSKDKGKDDKKAGKNDDAPPEVTFVLDPSASTGVRTPEEQAGEVADGKSWVCWGAHMADKARHVIMKVDGRVNWEPKKVFGDSFSDFKKEWAANMKGNSLKNASGGDGWDDGDSFHLELADSKIAHTDERVKACFQEYVRLTREKGKDKNDKFEKSYASELKSYIEAAEKKAGDKAKDDKDKAKE